MTRGLAAFALILASVEALATSPICLPLDQLVAEADHILVGRVTGAFARDEAGTLLVGPEARTGPCLANTIYLEIEVSETLFTSASQLPRTLSVPLDRWMHYSLGEVQLAHREASAPRLLLLQGEYFEPSVPGVFQWDVEDREYVMWLHEKHASESRSHDEERRRPEVGVNQPLADDCESDALRKR